MRSINTGLVSGPVWLVYWAGSVVSRATTVQEVHPSVAQRVVIEFLTNESISPSGIFTRLKSKFGIIISRLRNECVREPENLRRKTIRKQ